MSLFFFCLATNIIKQKGERNVIKTKSTKKQSMSTAAIIGFLSSVTITVLLMIGLTCLVLNDSLVEGRTGVVVFLIRALSVFCGSLIAGTIYKDSIIPVIGVVAGIYLTATIAVGIIAFNGSFHNFISGVLSVLFGGVLTFILRVLPKKRIQHGLRRIK